MSISHTENPRLKGLKRNKLIISTIEEWGALDTAQLQTMFFKSEYGQRKSQEVLLRLYRSGKLNRGRGSDCFYYYVKDKTPGMIKHLLATNWVRLWHLKNIASWEKLHSWSYEQDYKILRCDGFASIKNNMTGKFRFAFIETDRGTNTFDKIEKYNKLFDQQETLKGRWWYPLTDTFPAVVIVTVHPIRKDLILRQIEASNNNGLNFMVKYLDDIKREAVERC